VALRFRKSNWLRRFCHALRLMNAYSVARIGRERSTPEPTVPQNHNYCLQSRAKSQRTLHYILRKVLAVINNINTLQSRGRVYCSSRVIDRNGAGGPSLQAVMTVRGVVGRFDQPHELGGYWPQPKRAAIAAGAGLSRRDHKSS